MIKMSRWLASGLFVLAAAQIGCDRGPPEPVRAKVSGVVTFKGEPVEGANITFLAQGASGTGGAKTDKDGKFSFDAVVGKNVVTLSKFAAASEEKVSEEEMKRGNMAQMMEKASGDTAKNELPARYASVSDSGLTADVQTGKTNEFKFELTDAGAGGGAEAEKPKAKE